MMGGYFFTEIPKQAHRPGSTVRFRNTARSAYTYRPYRHTSAASRFHLRWISRVSRVSPCLAL